MRFTAIAVSQRILKKLRKCVLPVCNNFGILSKFSIDIESKNTKAANLEFFFKNKQEKKHHLF